MLEDRARFLPTDPEELIDASFACPFCLERASNISLPKGGLRRRIQCSCSACEATWPVSVTGAQFQVLVALSCRRMFRWPEA
jgi:transcription elongation factor Elf1